MNKSHEVIIIGAGISGLVTAIELKKRGIHDVLILEARNRIGGRVCNGEGITTFPLPLGAEFMHGNEHNVLLPYLEKAGIEFQERVWPEWIYIPKDSNRTKRDYFMHYPEIEEDHEISDVLEWFDEAENEEMPPAGSDIRASDWLMKKNPTPLQWQLADAVFASDFGASLDNIGLRELILENKNWIYGEKYLTLENGTFADLVAALSSEAKCPILFNTTVEEIKTTSSPHRPVQLSLKNSSVKYQCSKVIVTVPMGVMQSSSPSIPPQLRFNPPLPQDKQQVLDRLKTGLSTKLILVFSKRFWPEDMYDVVCPNNFVSELWMLKYNRTMNKFVDINGKTVTVPSFDVASGACKEDKERVFASGPIDGCGLLTSGMKEGEEVFAVTCFISGAGYERTRHMTTVELVKKTLKQLDEMFWDGKENGKGLNMSGMERVSPSACLAHYAYFDWSKDEFAHGGYAYPCYGAEETDRLVLARNVNDVIFFAGDATHHGVNPCVQGAAETGIRAAKEVAGSLYRKMLPAKL